MRITQAIVTAGVIVALGLLTASTAEAQQSARVPILGMLGSGTGQTHSLAAFDEQLRDLGYLENRNIRIERRFAKGQLDRLAQLATEMVRLPVDVIVALDPPATDAARNVTTTIPIVMRVSDDPVATGLVASLARPGGNLTGLYSLYSELPAKRLEVLREVLPGVSRLAVLWNPSAPGSVRAWKQTEGAAAPRGIRLQSLEVRRPDQLEKAYRAAVSQRVGAIIALRSPLVVIHRETVISLSAKYRLPTIYDDREFVEAGGLVSYGANLAELYRRAAAYVDKILKGARPADLPVEQPTTFELVINLKTAKALGLTIPPGVLARADKVIE